MNKFLDYFLCSLLVVLGAILLGLLFVSIDQGLGEGRQAVGIVVGRTHTAAYTSIALVGKATVVQHHPATWHLTVSGPHGVVSVSTSAYGHSTIPDSTAFKYTETTGYISNHLYSN